MSIAQHEVTTVTITLENFSAEVEQSTQPVLLEVWATWCIPCNLMKKAVAKAAEPVAGRAKVGLINVDQQPELVEKLGVRGTPTFFIYVDGKVVETFSGMTSSGTLVSKLNEHLIR